MVGWTENDIPPQDGRLAVVTGANSGLGFQAALQLARHGATVILACRDTGKGERAAQRIRSLAGGASVQVSALDLASLDSVRQFAAGFAAAHAGLDTLVNNAGVMAIPYRRTADGFEMQIGTNHFGHFALTGLLLPSLLARSGARVVTVSSLEADRGTMHFDDLQSEQGYRPWKAYRQSKLANQLFMLELDRLTRASGLDLVSAGAHPGFSATNLQGVGPRLTGKRWMGVAMALANRLFAQPASQGALPELYAATAPGVQGGDYFGPDRLMHSRGNPVKVSPTRKAMNADDARRLWEISEQLTGVHFERLAATGRSTS